jgi:hypothetical protein
MFCRTFLPLAQYSIPSSLPGSKGSAEPEQRTFEKFSLKARKIPGNFLTPWQRKSIYIIAGGLENI